jgi:hypothetical protein
VSEEQRQQVLGESQFTKERRQCGDLIAEQGWRPLTIHVSQETWYSRVR